MTPLVFGPWEPDKGSLAVDSIDTVTNLLPISNGWGLMQDLTAFTGALGAECKGAWWYRATDGTFATIAATQNCLFKLNTSGLTWTPIGKLGSDTILTGDFAADLNWTKSGGSVTISGGKAHFTASAAGQSLSQAQSPTASYIYKIVYTVSGYTAGAVTPQFTGGTTVSGTTVSANGTYTEYLTAVTGNNSFRFLTSGASTTLDIDNVSMKLVGGYTGPGTGGLWTAAVFGTNIYVTNINDPLQIFNIDSGTNFSDATGSPPQAKFIATVGDFLFLAHLKSGATTYPRKWQHCAVNDPTDWTISGVSGDSDDQEIPDGEEITGILAMAGSSARIFQRRARHILIFSPGSNPVFQQVDIEGTESSGQNRGLIAPHALVSLGGNEYFILNEHGFFIGDEFRSIGTEIVNEWFLRTVDRTKISYVQAAVDGDMIWVRFQDQSGIHQMIGCRWQFDPPRWTYSNVPATVLVSSASPGYVLDNLTGTLDSYSEPLDSSFWQGGVVSFGAFKADGILYLFSSNAAAATIETNTIQFNQDGTTFVTGAKLNGDLTNFTIQVGKAMLADSAISWSAAQTRSSRTGLCPERADARFHRLRLNITAGDTGTHVHGLMVDAEPSGEV